MKAKIITLMLAIIMVSCMSPEERKIKNWLNSKLTSVAEKVKSLEIVSEDSVLSIVPLDWMYNECLRHQPLLYGDSTYFEYGQYLYHAKLARSQVLDGVKKDASLISSHPTDWRKLYRLKVTGEDGTISNNVEVILDVDGSPILTGREYDTDLSLHSTKFNSISIIK